MRAKKKYILLMPRLFSLTIISDLVYDEHILAKCCHKKDFSWRPHNIVVMSCCTSHEINESIGKTT